ncbi:MAG: ATP-grasp domain-containing protein [Spirochaetota bacterium]
MFSLFSRRTKRKKLLISVGAGVHQIPLIQEAHRAGFRVIGVDINCSAAGFPLCDLRIQESIQNHDQIYNKIRELLADGAIAGAMTRSYGEAVRTTAYLNEKFNTPYIPLSRVDDLIDKKKMRNVLHKAGISSPSSRSFDSKKDSRDFPFILKPSLGHAKQGVRLIKDMHDLEKYRDEFPFDSKRHDLKEEYIDGDEIIASGIVHQGKFYLIEMTDKVMTQPPFFIDLCHKTPSIHAESWSEIEEIGQKTAEAFEISASPLLLEIRFNESGVPYVIEAIPEFGGEYITDVLVPASSGYNFFENSIKAVAGGDFQRPPRRRFRSAVMISYITHSPGKISSYTPIKKGSIPGLLRCEMFKGIGSEVRTPETNHDRIGVVITKGKTIEDAAAAKEAALNALSLTVTLPKKVK